MTEAEFDLLDELYFVKTYKELVELFETSPFDLDTQLLLLLEKKWIKALDLTDKEILLTNETFLGNKELYKYTATKTGLLAHNQR